MRRLCLFIVFITVCFPAFAEDLDGKAYLQKGKNEFEKKNYADAVSSLTRAEKEFPILGDYASLWLSDAYHESGNHQESLNTVRSLLKKYPHSPLIKKARSIEIREAEENSEKDIGPLFEAYLKDYAGDTEMKYLFARWLKKTGQADRAKSMFKDIYIESGPFSDAAYEELCPSDISVKDVIRRASNLTKLMNYKGAESLLRSAMEKDDGKLKEEILTELGHSLFKQKRYREAADVYRKAKDRYWELRSLYRAGEKDAVNAVLDDLLDSGEQKFATILMTVAADKRRDGKPEEALGIYRDLMKRFPSETEDALWGIGWTHFLGGEYQKSSEIFGRLYRTYGDTKYLYWKIRSLDASGQVMAGHDPLSEEKERNFYSIMLDEKIRGSLGRSGKGEIGKLAEQITPVKGGRLVFKKIDRVEALLDLGLRKEALSEMVYVAKKASSLDDILYICSKSWELGDYRLSVRSAMKAPYAEELHDFLYPLAYWNVVKSAAESYSIDPLLVLSIAREESRFDAEARSPAGAVGLMQLMPGTALKLDGRLKLGIKGPHDLMNPQKNLYVGIYYLSCLLKEFGSYPYAIAAYNAGEQTVRKWIQKGSYRSVDEFIEDIPYTETRNYVKRVITSFFEYQRSFAAGKSITAIPFEKL